MTQEHVLGQGISSALILVFAIATGAMVANIYYAQSIIALMAPDIGLSPAMAGWINQYHPARLSSSGSLQVTPKKTPKNPRLPAIMGGRWRSHFANYALFFKGFVVIPGCLRTANWCPEEDSIFFRKPLKLLASGIKESPLYQPCTNGKKVRVRTSTNNSEL